MGGRRDWIEEGEKEGEGKGKRGRGEGGGVTCSKV